MTYPTNICIITDLKFCEKKWLKLSASSCLQNAKNKIPLTSNRTIESQKDNFFKSIILGATFRDIDNLKIG
jgi:hypothetical protein